jgi:hypothetical protein
MFGLALGIALAVPSAMVGGVIGASSAHSEEEVDTATQSLLSALVAAAPDDALATNLPDVGRMNAGADLKLHDWKDGLAQNYKPLVDNGFDSAVEITVRAIRIDVIGDIDPDVSPVVIVEARLVSIPDGERLYERVWQYSGVERNFFRAAEDDARLFRSDLDNGYSHLASRIINDLFIARGVEKSRPPRPGTIVTIDGPVGDENTEHQIAETSIKATSNPAARSMTTGAQVYASNVHLASNDTELKNRFAKNSGSEPNNTLESNRASAAAGAQSSGTTPPLKSREEVELYLQTNEEDIAKQIFAYLNENDMIYPGGSHPTKAAGTAKLVETKIVQLSGDDVVISAKYLIPQSFQNAYGEREFVLRWISEDLVLLGRTQDQIPIQTLELSQDLDGTWEAQSSNLTASIEIEDRQYVLWINCASYSPMKVRGVLDEAGHLRGYLPAGRGSVNGTLESMTVNTNTNCGSDIIRFYRKS